MSVRNHQRTRPVFERHSPASRNGKSVAARSGKIAPQHRRKKALAATSRERNALRRKKSGPKIDYAKLAGQLTGARRAQQPKIFRPQLATLASVVPQGDRWIHEIKFDGYRILAFFENGRVRLVTRQGNDWTVRFRAVADAFEQLPLQSGILDGEIVSVNEHGISEFQRLQNSLKRGDDGSLIFYLFDMPHCEGFDLAATPLVERKELLRKLILADRPRNDGILRFSDHIAGQGNKILEHACRGAMEGIVSKVADGGYQQARTGDWRKVKCLKRQEFVIGGYSAPSGTRIGFGALLLGYYEGKNLVYSGRVGTGFTSDSLRQLSAELKKRAQSTPPFVDPPRGREQRGVTWVRPELVGEVEFTEWTGDGLLRHPSFQGLREDKPARQVVREKPIHQSLPRQRRAK
jgi:bifunctional non-homologous end joining protein LigD